MVQGEMTKKLNLKYVSIYSLVHLTDLPPSRRAGNQQPTVRRGSQRRLDADEWDCDEDMLDAIDGLHCEDFEGRGRGSVRGHDGGAARAARKSRVPEWAGVGRIVGSSMYRIVHRVRGVRCCVLRRAWTTLTSLRLGSNCATFEISTQLEAT